MRPNQSIEVLQQRLSGPRNGKNQGAHSLGGAHAPVNSRRGRRESAGFNRQQAEAIVRAIAESQDALVSKKDLEISRSSSKTDLAVMKWRSGIVIAGIAAQIFKTFFYLNGRWRQQALKAGTVTSQNPCLPGCLGYAPAIGQQIQLHLLPRLDAKVLQHVFSKSHLSPGALKAVQATCAPRPLPSSLRPKAFITFRMVAKLGFPWPDSAL